MVACSLQLMVMACGYGTCPTTSKLLLTKQRMAIGWATYDPCFFIQMALSVSSLKINPDPVMVATEGALWGPRQGDGANASLCKAQAVEPKTSWTSV
jgi:hypothetical protein